MTINVATSIDDAIAYEFYMDAIGIVCRTQTPDDFNLDDIDTIARASYSIADAFATARENYWASKNLEETSEETSND